jgi:hypothetical protein
MVILASTIGSQALSEYKVMLGAALNVGVTPVEAKEILYQAVPYVGIANSTPTPGSPHRRHGQALSDQARSWRSMGTFFD